MRAKKDDGKKYCCMQSVSIQTKCLTSSSKLKTTEEALRSLHQKSALLRFTDHVQDNGDVSGLLEDLQEAINDYQVCS